MPFEFYGSAGFMSLDGEFVVYKVAENYQALGLINLLCERDKDIS